MEAFHKMDPKDSKTADVTKLTLPVNGKPVTPQDVTKIGGGYNMFLQTSLPEKLRVYNYKEETVDTAHTLFITTFPRGFAVEILQVYSGPPVIAYKFKHWGYMEGPFKGHPPTGELVEMFGVSTLEKPFCNSLAAEFNKQYGGDADHDPCSKGGNRELKSEHNEYMFLGGLSPLVFITHSVIGTLPITVDLMTN
ncbi:pathogen-related protein-like protein [Tanacetum coccineum]